MKKLGERGEEWEGELWEVKDEVASKKLRGGGGETEKDWEVEKK